MEHDRSAGRSGVAHNKVLDAILIKIAVRHGERSGAISSEIARNSDNAGVRANTV
jgi:hypothetical protein